MHFKEHFQLCLHNFSTFMKQASEKRLTIQSQFQLAFWKIQCVQNPHRALDIRHSPNIFSCVSRRKTILPGIQAQRSKQEKKMNYTVFGINSNSKTVIKKMQLICQTDQKLKSGHRFNGWMLKTFSLLPENTAGLHFPPSLTAGQKGSSGSKSYKTWRSHQNKGTQVRE